mgnify:CR=1 FL=1
MARSQERSQRKASGGRYHSSRTKKKSELAGYPSNSRLADETKVRSKRTIGGNAKRGLLTGKTVNVAAKGKTQKLEITNVIENPANPNLVRRNVITKGTIVDTKSGKVRITSRPGQEGALNGILL